MKKHLLAAATVSTLLCSASAFAVDGTINFIGEIIATGCKLEGTNNTQTVTLPKVAKSVFASVNETAGRTPFTLQLTGCPQDTAGYIKFEGATVSGSADTLLNTGTAGEGVGIQVMKPNTTDLVIFNTKDGAGSFTGSQLSAGAIDLAYTAQYVAKDLATIQEGNVASSITLEISY